MPVRIGTPQCVTGLSEVVGNPIHATGVGLLLYGSQQIGNTRPTAPAGDGVASVFDRFKRWFSGEF